MRRFPLIRLALLILALFWVVSARGTLEVAYALLWACAVAFLFVTFPVANKQARGEKAV